MAQYRYLAIDGTGKEVSGALDAADEASLVDRLQREGFLLLRVDPADGRPAGGDRLTLRRRLRPALRRDEVAQFTRELAVMLGAGQDLDPALRFVVEATEAARPRAVFAEIRDEVRGGAPLSTALARRPGSFSRLYLGLVRAGESSGTLAATLAHLATMLEAERNLATTIRSALIYPTILVVAAVLSIVLMLVVVVPQFAKIFAESGAQLPAPTRFLLDAGWFLGNYGLWLLAAGLALMLLAGRLLAHPEQRLRIDRLLLRLPLVGNFVREAEAARFTRTLGTLLGNAVGLVAALQIAQEVIGNRAAAAAVERAIARVKDGAPVATALADGNAFPKRTLHLLRLGGETGELGQVALRAAAIHEQNLRTALQRAVAVLVPAITILMGLLVAGIIGSLLVAMLGINELAS